VLRDGTILGSYIIDGYIASGGMGVVYRAQHRILRRTVALKVLLDTYARDPKVRQRFEQEAMLQANLEHPNIVRVTDFLTSDTDVALVMDFVAGPSLDLVLEEEQPGPWSEADWLPMLKRVISAVAYAHAAGVVHRDIKPANVLLDRTNGRPGVPRIADFGIAKIVSGSSPAATRAGSRLGTVPYMAPEQFRGALEVGPAADVYALGMLAWRLAAGALPINSDDMVAATEMYIGQRPVLSFAEVAPSLSAQLARVLDSCLSLDPSGRPADARVLLDAMASEVPALTPASEALTQRELVEPTLASTTGPPPAVEPPVEASADIPMLSSPEAAVDVASEPAPETRWHWLIVVILILLAILLAVRDWVYTSRSQSPESVRPPASEARPDPVAPLHAANVPRHSSVEASTAPYVPTSRLPTDATAYVRIEPGTFRMGSPKGEKGRDVDEVRHTVTLTRPFYLKRTEVTQAEWRTLIGNNPSSNQGCDDCPVERVNWFEAAAFTNALSKQEGLAPCYDASCFGSPGMWDYTCLSVTLNGPDCLGYRLPTEAEWEYAARAGTSGARYGTLDSIAWYLDNSGLTSHPVGVKTPNSWGLSDMIGNVWEWCDDEYGDYPVGKVTNPWVSGHGGVRVRRGGSWQSLEPLARVGRRHTDMRSWRANDIGFRPARTSP